MMKCKNINQFRCLQFIEENFDIDFLEIELNDEDSIIITDCNNEKAKIYFDKDESKVLLEMLERWIIGEIHGEYICYCERDIEKVIENNGYITPGHIQEFYEKEAAFEHLNHLTQESEEIGK